MSSIASPEVLADRDKLFAIADGVIAQIIQQAKEEQEPLLIQDILDYEAELKAGLDFAHDTTTCVRALEEAGQRRIARIHQRGSERRDRVKQLYAAINWQQVVDDFMAAKSE